MTVWFRRNRWALIALVALVPAAVLAAFSINGFSYYGGLDHHPVVVASGSPAPYAVDYPQDSEQGGPPATFTLTSYTVVPWDTETGRKVSLLEGTEAVSALIQVDGAALREDAFDCDAILVAPGPEGDRTWEIASSNDIDYYPGGDLSAYCDLGNGEDFTREAVFVVPEGVGADAKLYVTSGNFPPERVLQLEH
ncbi:hypothetical protein BH09ACT4_BH09ACT4_10860 [soil metagenome]